MVLCHVHSTNPQQMALGDPVSAEHPVFSFSSITSTLGALVLSWRLGAALVHSPHASALRPCPHGLPL